MLCRSRDFPAISYWELHQNPHHILLDTTKLVYVEIESSFEVPNMMTKLAVSRLSRLILNQTI